MEREGEAQGVEGLAGHGVEDVQGTHWTKWTICDRACTRDVLRLASDIFYIIFECKFCISQNY